MKKHGKTGKNLNEKQSKEITNKKR